MRLQSKVGGWTVGFLLALLLSLPAAPRGAAGTQDAAPDPERGEHATSLIYVDPRLEQLPARTWVLKPQYTPEDDGKIPLIDPKFRQVYPRRVLVSCRVREEDGFGFTPLKFVVHYQERGDEPLARRVGALLARLYWIGRDYVNLYSSDNKFYDVWLVRGGRARGERIGEEDILLHGIEQPRPAAEWVREIAHEYGHLIFPPVGQYSAPEAIANGYLGERLLMKWLLADNRLTEVWDEPIDAAAYVRNQIEPLRTRFLNEGPLRSWEKLDAAGMERFIGAILAVEAAHGPEAVRVLMDRFYRGSKHPRSIADHWLLAARANGRSPLALNPAASVPALSTIESESEGTVTAQRLSYWLLLPAGRWEVDLEGSVPAGVTAAIQGAIISGAPPSTAGGAALEAVVALDAPVWRRFDVAAPPGRALQLRRIRITPK